MALLTTHQAAERLELAVRHVQRLVSGGDLVAVARSAPAVADSARARLDQRYELEHDPAGSTDPRVSVVRPTNDVDALLHVESGRGRAGEVARALEGLGRRHPGAQKDDDGRAGDHRRRSACPTPSVR